LKSGADFVPEEIGKKLDLDQSRNFGCRLIWRQMKGQIDRKNCQLFAKLAKRVLRGSSRVGRERKNTMKKLTTAQFIPVIALGCSALLYSITGCSRAPEAPPQAVSITCDDRMKYDVTAIEAKPGQKIAVTISNKGTTPKFSMGHNFILLDRNVNVISFLDTASMQAAHDYVPPEMEKKGVLAHSKLLGPGESDTVVFNAPFVPGEYVYLCSFPGHSTQGMRGTLTVRQ
jgi:azurin